MPMVFLNKWRRRILLLSSVTASAWVGGAWAQTGELDMGVSPSSHVVANTSVQDPVHDAQPPSSIAAQPAAADPIHLDHPNIINTAMLQSGAVTVSLFGIEGLSGEAVQGLQSFLASTDERLTCQARDTTGAVCLLSDGTDIAQVALVNGAARAKPDAPGSYKEQEASAQAARRGIWVNLPPPPETVTHPLVPNTATLMAAGKTYPLDGLQGLGQPYASQLQDYITTNGGSLSCSLQGNSGNYICLSGDGTDIAKVALVNGAARVGPDAPDSYRTQQAEALNNHRGFWLNPPPDAVAVALAPQPEVYTFVAGDDGGDGVTYVGGAPVALIDGESVFLVYGDDAGWGYYDHWHHWHNAPDRYRAHMEHYHPYGHGLRGYRHDEAFHRDAAFNHEDAMHHDAAFHHEEAMRHEAPRNHEEPMHPGEVRPGVMAGPAGRPGMAGGGFVHPGAMASAGGFRPGVFHAAPVMHASAAAAPAKHH